MTTLLSGTGAAQPTAYGGVPAFPDGLPMARPRVPHPDQIATDIAAILVSGTLTNGR